MKIITLNLIILLVFSACSTKYVTPGADVKISALADEDVAKVLSNKPTSEFPVSIAVARIQSPNYGNQNRHQNLNGNFSMILTREQFEEDKLQ